MARHATPRHVLCISNMNIIVTAISLKIPPSRPALFPEARHGGAIMQRDTCIYYFGKINGDSVTSRSTIIRTIARLMLVLKSANKEFLYSNIFSFFTRRADLVHMKCRKGLLVDTRPPSLAPACRSHTHAGRICRDSNEYVWR